MAKVTTENLAAEISKMLTEWENDELKVVDNAIKNASRLGVRALKADSPKQSGDYARGWSSRMEGDRVTPKGIIYNSKKPDRAHLLEHGHAKRGGGRVRAIVHIKPVEEEIITTLERELRHDL